MLASRPPAVPPAAHRSPVTLQDLLDDLLWPQLLRSWKLALAPGRVAICFVLVLVIGSVVALACATTKDAAGVKIDALGGLSSSVEADLFPVLHPIGAGRSSVAKGVYNAFIHTPAEFFVAHPILSLVCLPLILACWCFVGGGVCRSCACEVSLRAALPWRQAAAFGLRKLPANFAAIAGPLIAVWAACLVLRVLGMAFFAGKVVSIVGAVFFCLPLLLCLVVAVALVAYLVAHPLLIPAVACEGTDSFDAVQRCYAYVLARPGRLVGYIIVSLLATLPAAFVVGVIGMLGIYAAVTLTGAPAGPLEGLLPGLLKTPSVPPDQVFGTTRFFLGLWIGLVCAVGLAYFISLYFCAATNLYLVVRRLVDGQDIAELWTPPAPPSPSIRLPPASPAAAEPPLPPVPDKADYT